MFLMLSSLAMNTSCQFSKFFVRDLSSMSLAQKLRILSVNAAASSTFPCEISWSVKFCKETLQAMWSRSLGESIAAALRRFAGVTSHLANRSVSRWNLVPKTLGCQMGPIGSVLGCLPSIQLRRHCGSTTAHLSCETVMRPRAIADKSFVDRDAPLHFDCPRSLVRLLP